MVNDSEANRRRIAAGFQPLKILRFGGGEIEFDVPPAYTKQQKLVLMNAQAMALRNRAIHLREEQEIGLAGVGELFATPCHFPMMLNTQQQDLRRVR